MRLFTCMTFSQSSFLSLRHGFAAFFVFGVVAAAAQTAPAPQGVGNFYKVNERLYRGAQPTAEGFQNLSKLGVKTILDLREYDERSKWEEKAVTAAGMKYVTIPMHGAPTQVQLDKALAILNDADAGPVFVHCKRGADRTGTVIACYRIGHDNWNNAKAVTEARTNGMHWFEFAMQKMVMGYKAPTAAASTATTNATTVAQQ